MYLEIKHLMKPFVARMARGAKYENRWNAEESFAVLNFIQDSSFPMNYSRTGWIVSRKSLEQAVQLVCVN